MSGRNKRKAIGVALLAVAALMLAYAAYAVLIDLEFIVGLAAGYVILRKPEKREERIPLERLANGASFATICPNCGSSVDAVFCPSCGTKLPK
jgi:hypothetical protein